MTSAPRSNWLVSTGGWISAIMTGSVAVMLLLVLIVVAIVMGDYQSRSRLDLVKQRAQETARLMLASAPEQFDLILAAIDDAGLLAAVYEPSPERRAFLDRAIALAEGGSRPERIAPSSPPDDNTASGQRIRQNAQELRDRIRSLGRTPLAYVQEGSANTFWRISIPLYGSKWLAVETNGPPSATGLPRLAGTMTVIALVIVLAAGFVMRRLTAPLRQLESAAIRFGRELAPAPLPVRGPGDIRRVTHAFNEMQARLHRFVSDRTTMLAAISHDLRTPIQRLKFRAEYMDDDEQRTKMLHDLQSMERMIAATLDFARNDVEQEAPVRIDLAALVRELAAELAETGADVAVAHAPSQSIYTCRPQSLKRAIQNLAMNAVAYGEHARLSVDDTPANIVIVVDDDGPGIDPKNQERVFTPFFRADAARDLEAGGTGLGLSIVRSVARAHGGEVRLENRPEGGLRAKMILPR